MGHSVTTRDSVVILAVAGLLLTRLVPQTVSRWVRDER